MPTPPIASDGLPARESGEWAADKLWYVQRYMDIFTGAMKSRWPRRVFVDLMSGPGRCVVSGPPRSEFDGSPLLALRTRAPFTDVILIESNPTLAGALEKRVAGPDLRPTPSIIRDDCNSPAVIDKVRAFIGRDALSLAFVDLLGMNVLMQSIVRLTAQKLPIDLIVTFPEMDVVRNWQAARAEDPEHAPRFDAFFGTSKWRQTIDNVSAYQRESDSLMAFYTERLQAIGYLTSILPLTMKNNQGGTLYRPIFASRHEKGIEFWAAISGKDPSGQRRFW